MLYDLPQLQKEEAAAMGSLPVTRLQLRNYSPVCHPPGTDKKKREKKAERWVPLLQSMLPNDKEFNPDPAGRLPQPGPVSARLPKGTSDLCTLQ